MNSPGFSGKGGYEIVAHGHLDEQWSSWFEGMTITPGYRGDGTPITTFAGPLIDQAALHGVLATIRDLNLRLISVNQIATDSNGYS